MIELLGMNFFLEFYLIMEKDELEYGIKVFVLFLVFFFIIGMMFVFWVDFISRYV